MKDAFAELLEIIRESRKKCPWCKEQTLESYKDNISDEAAEVAKAIEQEDWDNLKEELGDVLYDTLHVIELGIEKGLFTGKEVIDTVNEKIRRRKPWVFGDEKVATAEEAVKRWNEIKAEEKAHGKN